MVARQRGQWSAGVGRGQPFLILESFVRARHPLIIIPLVLDCVNFNVILCLNKGRGYGSDILHTGIKHSWKGT